MKFLEKAGSTGQRLPTTARAPARRNAPPKPKRSLPRSADASPDEQADKVTNGLRASLTDCRSRAVSRIESFPASNTKCSAEESGSKALKVPWQVKWMKS